MKRLLRISFNSAVFSFIPILSWFALGLIVDKDLTNVFTLTYPIQFIWAMMKSIFGTGANISKEKDKNENAVIGFRNRQEHCCPFHYLGILRLIKLSSFSRLSIFTDLYFL